MYFERVKCTFKISEQQKYKHIYIFNNFVFLLRQKIGSEKAYDSRLQESVDNKIDKKNKIKNIYNSGKLRSQYFYIMLYQKYNF